MDQGGGKSGLAEKPLNLFRFDQDVLPNDLEDDRTLQETVISPIDSPHAANVEQFTNAIAGMVK
jgi:hypothetical protein